jgi:hypothetical protein
MGGLNPEPATTKPRSVTEPAALAHTFRHSAPGAAALLAWLGIRRNPSNGE